MYHIRTSRLTIICNLKFVNYTYIYLVTDKEPNVAKVYDLNG